MRAIVESRPGAARLRVAANRAEAVTHASIARGQTLFFEGDDARYFFEIQQGTLRCCRMIHDGRRQIYRFVGAGEMLGLGCEYRYGYSAEAVTDVVVRRHRIADLDFTMTADAGMRRRVLQALRGELAATRSQMMLLGRMSASEKLASFLLSLAGTTASTGACIELPMTRSDIADYLGLTIETVSRKLNELRGLGVICLETPNRVRITDQGRIEAIADAA